jgi:hypothetical protein
MANSRYIKGQRSGALPEYLDQELRRIEMMFMPPTWVPVTFQNGWANFGGIYETAAYYKSISGFVYVRGLVAGGTLAAFPGAAIFTLPADCRPRADLLFAQDSNPAAHIRVDVKTDGTVRPIANGVSTNIHVSINFSFFAGG